jgi:aminoglycoside phosphotransferase family enzyme
MGAQDETLAFLRAALAGEQGGPVETIETHISVVLMAGDRAWKLKRAVTLPYLDFSTPDLRLAAARTELALNRRTAPGLYLGLRRIARAPTAACASATTARSSMWWSRCAGSIRRCCSINSPAATR